MIKKYKDYNINEGLHNDISYRKCGNYVLYVEKYNNEEIKKIYDILFKNGYTIGGINEVKFLKDELINDVALIIIHENKRMLYARKNIIIDDSFEMIADFINRYVNNKVFYYIKELEDFYEIFGHRTIKNYFNKNNIYESLLDNIEGPSKDEVEDKLKQRYDDGKINILGWYRKTKELDIPTPSVKEIEDGLRKMVDKGSLSTLEWINKLKGLGCNTPSKNEIEYVLKKHYNIRIIDINGWILLAKKLKVNGPTENEILKGRYTGGVYRNLLYSCESGNIIGIKKALKSGANINGDQKNGLPMFYAIQSGDLKCIQYLIDNGADLESHKDINDAIYSGNIEVVKLLLKNGVNVDKHTIYYAEHVSVPKNEEIIKLIKQYKTPFKTKFKMFGKKIKNTFNESLLDNIEGPSKEEVLNSLNIKGDSIDECFEYIIKESVLNPIDDFNDYYGDDDSYYYYFNDDCILILDIDEKMCCVNEKYINLLFDIFNIRLDINYLKIKLLHMDIISEDYSVIIKKEMYFY